MKIGEARRADRRLMRGSKSQAYFGVTFIIMKPTLKNKIENFIIPEISPTVQYTEI